MAAAAVGGRRGGRGGGWAHQAQCRRGRDRDQGHRARDGRTGHSHADLRAGVLTNQVRGIAKVVTAVANGDLKRNSLSKRKARSPRSPTPSMA